MNTNPLDQTQSKLFKSNWADTIALWSVGTMAFSINFGVAMVSISSLLIVVSALLILITKQDTSKPLNPLLRPVLTVSVIPLALLWMAITGLWTESSIQDASIQLMRYSRLLVIPIIFYLIRTPEQSMKVLKVWIYGQVFVIATSYFLWFKLPLPWTTNQFAFQNLTPYTSTLEQPIMNTIMFIVFWYLKDSFIKEWGRIAVTLISILTVFEVFFLMQGRTGYVCMLLALTLIAWKEIGSKFKILVIFLPMIIFGGIYTTSPKFEQRVNEVVDDVKNYKQGNKVSSQGTRLDFSKKSIDAIQEKPLLGYGLGSWPIAYRHVTIEMPTEMVNGERRELVADNPHEQFLLWFVEGGVVAFILLLGIYFSIYRDSKKLTPFAKNALQLVLATITLASFMNCPFHGAGMSEFLCFVIAVLLNFVKSPKTSTAGQ